MVRRTRLQRQVISSLAPKADSDCTAMANVNRNEFRLPLQGTIDGNRRRATTLLLDKTIPVLTFPSQSPSQYRLKKQAFLVK